MLPQNLEIIYTKQDIKDKVQDLANILKKDYYNKDLVIISVLNGAVVFTVDLIKQLEPLNYQLHFCKCSSYIKQSKGKSHLELPNLDLKDKHVLILDDIHDTGETITKIYSKLKDIAISVSSAVVINRITSNKMYMPTYSLYTFLEDDWFVGYGMDLDERYRGLDSIYKLKPTR